MTTHEWFEQRFRISEIEGPSGRALREIDEERALAQAVVDTIREPLLILDQTLRVVDANRAFYCTFKVNLCEVQDQPFATLVAGQLNIPDLNLLLATIVSHHTVMDAYEVEAVVPELGQRTLLLDGRPLLYRRNGHRLILLTFKDITAQRITERKTAALLRQKEILVREMQHRIGNSLQIIASILLLKARNGCSDDTRLDLQDAHRRILAVAAVQQHLSISPPGEQIRLAPHLSRLCKTLESSMVSSDDPVTIKVLADGVTISSAEIVSIGLIVTELVINALKHAFVADTAAGLIVVAFEADEARWKLAVSDNGVGMPDGNAETVTPGKDMSGKGRPGKTTPGLGTGIVEALARQLDGRVERSIGLNGVGTSVSIIHESTAATVPWAGDAAGRNQMLL